MKPNEYRQSYTVNEDTPYQVEEGQLKGTHASTGILQMGRVVWIREHSEERAPDQPIRAYAEGIGLVSLAGSLLSPAV